MEFDKKKLAVIILTKNEEKNIEKCLKSIYDIADELIVVDSGSTDKTEEICKKYNVKFVYNEFINHSTQFNWALENIEIESEWIFRLDADEEVLLELKKEIKEELSKNLEGINGFILKRRVYFMGKWIKHGGVYPTKLLRIFRKNFGVCEQLEMDEHLVLLEGATKELKNDFIDYNNNTLEWWISKHNWYSEKEKKEYFKTRAGRENQIENRGIKRVIKNKGYYNLPIFFRPWLYYIYRYYFRFGFLDGKEGKIFHFLQGYWYRFLVDAKIYEKDKMKK